jgi:hypothetical protein
MLILIGMQESWVGPLQHVLIGLKLCNDASSETLRTSRGKEGETHVFFQKSWAFG